MKVRNYFPLDSEGRSWDRKLSKYTPIDKESIFKQSDSKCLLNRKIKISSQKFRIHNCRPINSELCGRSKNTFIAKATSKFPSMFCGKYKIRIHNCLEKDRKIAGGKAIIPVQNEPDQFLSSIFIVAKKIERLRSVINSKKLNSHLE